MDVPAPELNRSIFKMSLDEQTACFSAVCRSITVQKRSLLRVAVGQDGRLGDIKVKSSILLQDVLQVSQNLKRYTEHEE